jgi:hypothetical protein
MVVLAHIDGIQNGITQEEKMRSIHVGCEVDELSPLV